jgi:hypothetical protein
MFTNTCNRGCSRPCHPPRHTRPSLFTANQLLAFRISMTQKDTEAMAAYLTKKGVSAHHYHAGMASRERKVGGFKKGAPYSGLLCMYFDSRCFPIS